MIIKSQEACPESSAFAAVVEVRGLVYAVTLVAGHLYPRLVPYKNKAVKARASDLRQIEKWAREQIAALGPEWMAAHNALYGVAE